MPRKPTPADKRPPYPPDERAGSAFELASLAVELAKMELIRFQAITQQLQVNPAQLAARGITPPSLEDFSKVIRSVKADDYFKQAAALLQKAEAESAWSHKGSVPISQYIGNDAERAYYQSKTNVSISGPEDEAATTEMDATSHRHAIHDVPELSKVTPPASFPASSLECWRAILRRSPTTAELNKAREQARRALLQAPNAGKALVEQLLTDEITNLGTFWWWAAGIAPLLPLYRKNTKPRRSHQKGSEGQFAGTVHKAKAK